MTDITGFIINLGLSSLSERASLTLTVTILEVIKSGKQQKTDMYDAERNIVLVSSLREIMIRYGKI